MISGLIARAMLLAQRRMLRTGQKDARHRERAPMLA